MPLRFVRRIGETVNTTLVLAEDPRIEVVPIEQIGTILNDDQKRFRESWLSSRQKRYRSRLGSQPGRPQSEIWQMYPAGRTTKIPS
ncbi:MAG: hypothetical protein Q8O42_23045 [Acidobacteriota bacterium]|nr:hypothetical protein [Acidobacteriota bacterium]